MRAWVLLTDGFGGHGGIALYNRHLLRALCGHPSVQKVVAFPRIAPNCEEEVPANLEYQSESAGGAARYLLSLVKSLREGGRPDLLFCTHINLWPVASVAASLFGIPTVLVLYGVEAWSKPGFLRAANIKKAARIICISTVTRDRFLKWADVERDSVEILPNAIELSDYGAGEKPAYLLERYGLTGKKILLTVGRIDEREKAKGFDEVLDVMPALLAQDPDIRYLVAGDGSDLGRLRREAVEKQIESAVIFAGRIAEREKADHYRLADLYVMPSRWEGFGYVFLEAMACGIPVIASKTDGGHDAVRGGTLGMLVEPGDQRQLRERVFEGLQKPRKVPEGLSYFSKKNFDMRVGRLIDSLIGDEAG